MKIKTQLRDTPEAVRNTTQDLIAETTRLFQKWLKEKVRPVRPSVGTKTMAVILLTEDEAEKLLHAVNVSGLPSAKRRAMKRMLTVSPPEATPTVEEIAQMSVMQVKQLLLNKGASMEKMRFLMNASPYEIADKMNIPAQHSGEKTWLMCIRKFLTMNNDD